MKKAILTILIFISSLHILQSQNESALTEIADFRNELNAQFSDEKKSPLTEEDRAEFKALEFLDIDLKYRVVARLELTPNAAVFEMATTTDRLPLYKKYAIAYFSIENKEYQLSLYQNQRYIMSSPDAANHLFLPFSDSTNGSISYGGGRYMDLEIPENGGKTIIIDFNQTYNPYCAYNKKYSCPIPPRENNLQVAIPVGIKAYSKKH